MFYSTCLRLDRLTRTKCFGSYADSLIEEAPEKCMIWVGSWPNPETLGKVGNVCQGPEAGLLNKHSCSAAAFVGVTKFIAANVMNSITLCCAP